MGIYGQDWASYQSATPDTSGLAFFFTKVTEGLGYVNPLWPSQYAHGLAAGLVPGKYHYPHMGNSVQAEGDRFLSVADIRPGDVACLDWEGYDPANSGVPKAQQAAYKDAWLRYVKSKLPNNRVGMYCNTDYWRNVDTSGFYGDFLWIATAGLPAGSPGITAPWLFHQYSDNPVDKDYCHLASAADLRAWASPSGGTDMPLTPADAQLVAETLLNTTVPNQFRKDAKGEPAQTPVNAFLTFGDHHFDVLSGQLAAVKAELDAVKAQLGTVAAPTLSDAQVKALAAQLAPVLIPQLVQALGHALDGTPPAKP
jgi:hypothetical protein